MASAAGTAQSTDFGRAPRAPGIRGLGFAGAFAIGLGWWSREATDLVPDAGLGYGLGVVGLALMATLPLYSLRKRARFMQSWGSLRSWFAPHMAIGVIGPVAILFHCNFSPGSLNSSVALFCMLVVAGSGFVGRFIYGKIHCGLTGRRRSLEELAHEVRSGRNALGKALKAEPRLSRVLEDFERFALTRRRSLLAEMCRMPRLGWRARASRRAARQILGGEAGGRAPGRRPALDAVDRAIVRRLAAMRRVGTFTVYARLFSMWHAMHVPLCILLFTCAAVHVVAVHMY